MLDDFEVYILDSSGAGIHHCNNGQTVYKIAGSEGYADIACDCNGGIAGYGVKIVANRDCWAIGIYGLAILNENNPDDCTFTIPPTACDSTGWGFGTPIDD